LVKAARDHSSHGIYCTFGATVKMASWSVS
jgi:hypothetical protein